MSKFILRMKDMTAKSDKDLCPSCSHVYERKDRFGTTRECNNTMHPKAATVHGQVTDCTDYYPKNLPSLRDMTYIAWDLSTTRKNGKIGFTVITPADRKAANKDLDVPDWD